MKDGRNLRTLGLILALCLMPMIGLGTEAYNAGMNAGKEALRAQQYESAREAFVKAAAEAPNPDAGAQAYSHAALASLRLGQMDQAEKEYRKITEMEGVSQTWKGRAFEQIGLLYVRQKQPKAAREAFRQILENVDADVDMAVQAKHRLAEVELEEDQIEAARQLYVEIADTASADPNQRVRAAFALADLALKQGDMAAARTYYGFINELDWRPVHLVLQSQIKMGDCFMHEAAHEAARAEYQKVLDHPRTGSLDHSIALYKIAESYEAEGNAAMAKAHYERLIALERGHAGYKRQAAVKLEAMAAEPEPDGQ